MTEAAGGVFVSARWADLLMLNYEVDPSVLAPWLPRGVELDDFGGRHLVSVVGFRFLRTAVLGVRVPFHGAFEEVNLRLYVRREVDAELRRGVAFVKEIVPRRAVSWVANGLYNEHYITRPMRHERRELQGGGLGLHYGYRDADSWWGLSGSCHGEPSVPPADSEPGFIAEHYYGYVSQRDGRSLEYRVEHPPWRAWTVSDPELHIDTATIYGPDFAPFLTNPPSSALIAEGSDVGVHRGVLVV